MIHYDTSLSVALPKCELTAQIIGLLQAMNLDKGFSYWWCYEAPTAQVNNFRWAMPDEIPFLVQQKGFELGLVPREIMRAQYVDLEQLASFTLTSETFPPCTAFQSYLSYLDNTVVTGRIIPIEFVWIYMNRERDSGVKHSAARHLCSHMERLVEEFKPTV
jgi:hypothetical protein